MVASPRKATLHDVAKRAHVSVASVSNYLNDYPYMKPATRERIQQAIDELGYVTNQQARNLRSGRTGLISLSLPDLNQIYFSELAEEIDHAGTGIWIPHHHRIDRKRPPARVSRAHMPWPAI